MSMPQHCRVSGDAFAPFWVFFPLHLPQEQPRAVRGQGTALALLFLCSSDWRSENWSKGEGANPMSLSLEQCPDNAFFPAVLYPGFSTCCEPSESFQPQTTPGNGIKRELQVSSAFSFSPLSSAPGFWRECQPLVWGKLWKQHPALPNPQDWSSNNVWCLSCCIGEFSIGRGWAGKGRRMG